MILYVALEAYEYAIGHIFEPGKVSIHLHNKNSQITIRTNLWLQKSRSNSSEKYLGLTKTETLESKWSDNLFIETKP